MELTKVFSTGQKDYSLSSETNSFNFQGYYINPLRMNRGNSKLYQMLVFDMPAVATCLNCESCKAKCYAMKAQRIYPNTKVFRYTNLALFNKDKRVLLTLLVEQLKRTKFNVVRLHSSGDFFSQAYIDFWAVIVAAFPNIQFYAYTKVKSMLDFSNLEKLSNFNLIDSFVGGKLNFGSLEYCKELETNYNSVICPATLDKGVKCNRECNYCVTNNNVCFVEH